MKVTFENATIADSIGKAARVAPTKGEAFDKASGIVMEIDATDPDDKRVTIKATNLDIFYLEVVDAVEIEGDGETVWRFHAGTLSQVLSKLPIGSGKNVTLEQKGPEVHMKSGRTSAKFRLIDASYYPKWEPFDPELLEVVPDLGARIQQVEWAAIQGELDTVSGIHIDGTHVVATDRVRLALVECETDVFEKPITIPAGILKPVLANLRDVAVGVEEGMFLLMPDVSTQLRTRIYGHEYPPVKKALDRQWPNKLSCKKQGLLELIERAEIFAQKHRDPPITVIIGKKELACFCSDTELGLLGDVIDVDGADHDRIRVLFTPRNLKDALNGSPSDQVILHYNVENTGFPFKIDGGSGYTAVVMPRRDVNPTGSAG